MDVGDSNNQIPSLFSKSFVPVHIIIFVLSSVLIHVFDLPKHLTLDGQTAVSVLSTHTEVLVAIFSVTMGVTLLGLQFRAQSYSMLALIQHMKDTVIYGFVAVFLTLIVFTMVASAQPVWINPITAVPYAILGTVFSLLYLVGYVYYMIYRTQPEQVIQSLGKAIIGITPEIIVRENRLSKKFESFQVWEQIMLRAVENDDVYVFSNGMDQILLSVINCRKLCQDSQKDDVGKFFSRYITAVLAAAVRTDRKRFVSVFMSYFEKISEPMPDKGDLYYKHRMMMFRIWELVMSDAILHRNTGMQNAGMISMDQATERYMNESGSLDATAAAFLHTYIYRLAYNAVYEGQNHFLVLYMECWARYCSYSKSHKDDNSWDHSTPIGVWAALMIYAGRAGNHHLF